MSISGPAPSRMASRCMRRSRSTLRSTLISGSNGEPKAGPPALRLAVGVIKNIGLQRGEFFSFTSRPIALTPSRSVIAGLYQPGWLMRQVAQCDQ